VGPASQQGNQAVGTIEIKAIHWTASDKPYRVNVHLPHGEVSIRAFKTPGGARRHAARAAQLPGGVTLKIVDLLD
jgi:hypothetical protein